MADLELWISIRNISTYSVRMNHLERFDNLRIAIWRDFADALRKLGASNYKDLELWRVESPALYPEGHEQLLWPNLSEAAEKVDNCRQRLGDHVFTPVEDGVHVAVTLPASVSSPSLNDITTQLLENWTRPVSLPPVNELSEYFNRPLPEDRKVPLKPSSFQAQLIIHDDPRLQCTAADVNVLFRESTSEYCRESFALPLLYAYRMNPPHASVSEATFHFFWDNNIAAIIVYYGGLHFNRDSSRHSSTKRLRPDAFFIMDNLCVLRGEEKAPWNDDGPRGELAEMLHWTYDPAPYVLGYYAIGATVSHVAILPPQSGSRRPIIRDIATYDLQHCKNRIQHLRHIIRLLPLLRSIATIIGFRDQPEFTELRRGNKTIELYGRAVRKIYSGNKDDLSSLQEFLKSVYDRLKIKGVIEVDSIQHIELAGKSPELRCYLEPRCINRRPCLTEEVFDAVECVLKALIKMHANPPLFHRDIRWPNIVLYHGDQWILIDFEESASPPNCKPALHLDKTSHCPRVFVNNHGAEVDVWAVGYLLAAHHHNFLGYPQKMAQLGSRIQEESLLGLSAMEALDLVRELRRELSEVSE